MTDTIGFIGLGSMGLPISSALATAGFSLAVFDTNPSAADSLVEVGTVRRSSLREISNMAGVVFTCLPTPEIVAQVLAEPGGILSGSAVETVVDLSTIGAATARRLAEQAERLGVSYVDAPVSGGVAGARAKALAVMASGNIDAFERVRPLLETFGKSIFHVGSEPGQGQIAKVLNNLLSATSVVITAEVTGMALRAGLDVETALAVFSAGSGRNTATADKFPKQVLTRRFASGFKLSLMNKDLQLCMEEAQRMHTPLPVGSLVQQFWTLAENELPENSDHTEIVRLFEQWSGAEFRSREG